MVHAPDVRVADAVKDANLQSTKGQHGDTIIMEMTATSVRDVLKLNGPEQPGDLGRDGRERHNHHERDGHARESQQYDDLRRDGPESI